MRKDSSRLQAENPQFVKVGWDWFEGLCVGLLALIGVDILLGFLLFMGGELNQSLSYDTITASVFGNFSLYTISRLLGISLILTFVYRRRGSLASLGLRGFSIKKALGYIIAASLVLIVASTVVFAVLDAVAPTLNLEEEQQLVFDNANTKLELALTFMSLVLIAPVVEEIIFRGLMFSSFSQSFGPVAGAIFTSALFGLIHGQFNVALVTFIMGLLLAWIYYKTRSLWPAILFHSIKNGVAFILVFYETIKLI